MHFVLETLFTRLISSASIDAPLLILPDGCCAESFSNEQGLSLILTSKHPITTLHDECLQVSVNLLHFLSFRVGEFNYSHWESFWQDLRLLCYEIATDSSIQVYCWGIGLIVWAFCMDCAVQCFTPSPLYSSSDGASHLRFAGSSSHNLFDLAFDKCPHRRSVQTLPQTPLLRLHFFSVQPVGCTTRKCDSNEVGKSPALHAATRCDGDAAVMQW
jgi:hypothetical protein